MGMAMNSIIYEKLDFWRIGVYRTILMGGANLMEEDLICWFCCEGQFLLPSTQLARQVLGVGKEILAIAATKSKIPPNLKIKRYWMDHKSELGGICYGYGHEFNNL